MTQQLAYKVAKRTLGIAEFKFERITEKNTFGNKPLGMRTLIGISGEENEVREH